SLMKKRLPAHPRPGKCFFYSLLFSLIGLANAHAAPFPKEATVPKHIPLKHPITSSFAKVETTVTGTVVDKDGIPIPGVTVSVPGTTIGTATDLEGRYSLDVPEGATLVFSFIGFQTQSIAIGNRNNIDVTLLEELASLDEVVVVGYGTSQKRDLPGAVTRVNLDQNRLQPNVNPVQSLRGTVAVVSITDNGRPGSDGTIP